MPWRGAKEDHIVKVSGCLECRGKVGGTTRLLGPWKRVDGRWSLLFQESWEQNLWCESPPNSVVFLGVNYQMVCLLKVA